MKGKFSLFVDNSDAALQNYVKITVPFTIEKSDMYPGYNYKLTFTNKDEGKDVIKSFQNQYLGVTEFKTSWNTTNIYKTGSFIYNNNY